MHNKSHTHSFNLVFHPHTTHPSPYIPKVSSFFKEKFESFHGGNLLLPFSPNTQTH